MVKLEAKNTRFGGIFYFHNMKDCNKFLYTFQDHWCNVKWKEPIEAESFDDISECQRKDMDKSPKKRAEDNLSWGFSLCKDNDQGLTDEQKDFINKFIEEGGY